MVALEYPVLDCPLAMNDSSNESNLVTKKVKRKKGEKDTEIHNGNRNKMEMAKISAIKEMVSEVKHLAKKKKKDKKKKHCQGDVAEDRENHTFSSIEDQSEVKKKKHKKKKHADKQERVTITEARVEDKSQKKSKKRKRSDIEADSDKLPAGNVTENNGLEQPRKKKKNKKSKYDNKVIAEIVASDAKTNLQFDIDQKENANGCTQSVDITNKYAQDGKQANSYEQRDVDQAKKKKKKEKRSNDVEQSSCNADSSRAPHKLNEKDGERKQSDEVGEYQEKEGPFKKDFYSTCYLSASHEEEKETVAAEQYRKEQKITMYGKGKSNGQFHPVLNFSQLGFKSNIMEAVKDFKEPTPIQAAAWPVIASGRDTIGIAETGSGKTLAFSIPALAHLTYRLEQENSKGRNNRRGPMMLIVAPTRELAQQSQDVLESAGKPCGVRCISVYGGVPKALQREALSANRYTPYEVVVATPGRLKDLMEEGSCDLSDVSYLVLDEADRMLDQGFERDVRKIISATHPQRQTCLFSATWPESVRELAHEFLKKPIKITIGSDDLTAGSTIEQIVEVIDDERQRQWKLLDLLKNHKSTPTEAKADKKKRVLIFVLYKKEASRIEDYLASKDWSVTSIHGDKTQAARQAALDSFKSGRIPLLVATDVAARGLDIPDVDLVINYSFPLTIEDYVHRIGRTGRAGKKGRSYTFFQSKADKLRAGELVKVLRDAGQAVPEKMLSFDLSIRKKEHKLYGSFGPKDYNVPMKNSTRVVFGDDD